VPNLRILLRIVGVPITVGVISSRERLRAFFVILAVLAVASQSGHCANVQPSVQASVTLIRQERAFDAYQITFPSPVQNAVPPNGTVYVEYWVPKRPGPMPAVVLLHHWGVIHPTVERELAVVLAHNGIITAMLVLPYHMQRTPPGFRSGRAMLSADIPRLVRSVEQSVLEVGALVGWLKSRPEVNPKEIGLAGVSLGAIIGALVLGEIDQFDAAVLILGGANVADILWTSPITLKIRPALRRLGYTKERLEADLASVEPLNRLTPAQGRNVLMVNAIHDPVIPRRDTLALWDALGQSGIVWVESGHYIPIWGRRKIDQLAAEFFLYRFGERASFNAPTVLRLRRVKVGVLVDRSPAVGFGAGIELLKSHSGLASLDLNLWTGGASIGAGLNLSNHLFLGIQRKLFSEDRDFLPYAMVSITL